MSDSELNVQQPLRIRRGFRLQWEPVQNGHVLLYPEGMIQLNDSAAHILKLVDGQRNIEQIIAELQLQFADVPGLDEDVLTFMGVAHAQFWLEYC
ncbi:MAG: pyrroloquinoline quinone biosynthesis peptide chaperone PqqD [Pseudomonas sp.]|jgi:pyrroloquinoline quinone biosynthesis protein D|nr:pyrroloquinoline quinone biosynthesis peptide chaperone PqqD [Pseudomonas sp.]MDY0415657.1 pyrroloquinoline quinone biosynthesis peptide chaperone PqqD [Pseudomonas sp.]